MNRPPRPPYGELIETARENARLSRREAARRAGISDSWWRYVAAGWQNGPVPGSAETVAAMARVVNVSPEELEAEGERPDAARVLREMLREKPPPARSVPDLAEAPDVAAVLFPGDKLKQAIWRLLDPDTGEPLPEAQRAGLVAHVDKMRAGNDNPGERTG